MHVLAFRRQAAEDYCLYILPAQFAACDWPRVRVSGVFPAPLSPIPMSFVSWCELGTAIIK